MTCTASAKANAIDVSEIQQFVEKNLVPLIREDGGDLRFERVEAGAVYLAMGAACANCPSRYRTAEHFIRARLRQRYGPELPIHVRFVKPYFAA